MQNGSLGHIGRPPSWFLKIKCLTTGALERPILHHCAKFHEISHTGVEISRIFATGFFLVKYKNSLNDITSKLTDN